MLVLFAVVRRLFSRIDADGNTGRHGMIYLGGHCRSGCVPETWYENKTALFCPEQVKTAFARGPRSVQDAGRARRGGVDKEKLAGARVERTRSARK